MRSTNAPKGALWPAQCTAVHPHPHAASHVHTHMPMLAAVRARAHSTHKRTQRTGPTRTRTHAVSSGGGCAYPAVRSAGCTTDYLLRTTILPARCPVVRSTDDAPRRTVPLTGASIALCAHCAHTYQPPRSRIGIAAAEGCRTASALLSAHPGPTYPLACRAWAPHLGAVPLSFLPLSLLAPV